MSQSYEQEIQGRAAQVQPKLKVALRDVLDSGIRTELREAYRLIDDLMVTLYGEQAERQDTAAVAEPTPEEIKKITAMAAGRTFLLQQRINRSEKLLAAATEFRFAPDLTGIEHREYLDPRSWLVRISQDTDGRWYLWRGDPRNPDADPCYAFYDGKRFVPETRISRIDRVLFGTDDSDLQAQRLKDALDDQVLLAGQVADRIAADQKRVYRHS